MLDSMVFLNLITLVCLVVSTQFVGLSTFYIPKGNIKKIFISPSISEFTPLTLIKQPPAVFITKPVTLNSALTFRECRPHLRPPAEIYGPPIETKEISNKYPVELKEAINVPPLSGLPPTAFSEILPTVIVSRPVKVVSLQKPVQFAPYPPHSEAPAETYGPPVEIKEVFNEPTVETKEEIHVPLPPELPPVQLLYVPQEIAIDKPSEVVSLQKPVHLVPHPPHSEASTETYGPPVEIKEVLNEPTVETKEEIHVPPPPELPPVQLSYVPQENAIDKCAEIVSVQKPIQFALYLLPSEAQAETYGPPVEIKEVFNEPTVETKEVIHVPPPPELPPVQLSYVPQVQLQFAPYPPHSEAPVETYGPPVEIKEVFNAPPVAIKELMSVPPPPELPPLEHPYVPQEIAIDKPSEVVSLQKPVHLVPYPPHSEAPAETYGPPVEIKEVFNEPTVETKEEIHVLPPPELPPVQLSYVPQEIAIDKPSEVVSLQKPVHLVPYPPHSEAPAETYGPPVEIKDVFNEPTVETKEEIHVPPPPELPPVQLSYVPQVQLQFAPYPPHSEAPVETYGPPVEIKEVFNAPPVAIKELMSVPPPPELPPLEHPYVPQEIAIDKPSEIVSLQKPVHFAPYPPHSEAPAESYGPPVEIKKVFNEPTVETKEVIHVPPPPELPPVQLPYVPQEISIAKPAEVVSVQKPVQFALYPPHSEAPAETYGPPVEIKEVFNEPTVETKEVIHVPPPPELPPVQLSYVTQEIAIDKPSELVSLQKPVHLVPFPPHSEAPAETYGPPVEIKEVFNEPTVETKEVIHVPPPPELLPVQLSYVPQEISIAKPAEVVSVQKPVQFSPYPPHSEAPAETYGPPVEIKEVFNEPTVETKEVIHVPPPPELPPVQLSYVTQEIAIDKPSELVSLQKPVHLVPYPPHSEAPAETYGPPVEIKEVFNEPTVETKEEIHVPPPPELPPVQLSYVPQENAIDKYAEIVSVQKPVQFASYLPPSEAPAETYGPPVEIKEVFNEPTVETKEEIHVPPPPELPPVQLSYVPQENAIDKYAEIVSVQKPVQFASYLPPSEAPAETYGPPVEIKEVFNEPTVETKEEIHVPPPPELPPVRLSYVPQEIAIDKPSEIVSLQKPVHLAPYPPHSEAPAETYGPPVEIKEVFNEPTVETKEEIHVPPPPELPPVQLPYVPQEISIAKPAEVVSVQKPVQFAPCPPNSEASPETYGSSVDMKEIFNKATVETKEAIHVPPPPELPSVQLPYIPTVVVVDKPAETVSVQKPVVFASYPPHSGPPAKVYGPPLQLKNYSSNSFYAVFR